MKILIADDHGLLREALSLTVTGCFPAAQITLCADFDAAFAQAAGQDLIITDLSMPGADAMSGVARLRAAEPKAKIVILTGQEDDALLLAILRLGVEGFLTKATEPSVIGAALQLVWAGGTYSPPRLLQLQSAGPVVMAVDPVAESGAVASGVEGPFGRLSARHREVLALLIQGATNKQIARQLEISPATAKSHVAHILGSLGAVNRTEAAQKARALGLL